MRIDGWIIVLVAFVYVGLLFAVAYAGDRWSKRRPADQGRPLIYALSLAVYCTSWTFFGSVGLATTTGLGFLPVYLGPILLFAVGYGLLQRVVRLAKSQNITSIADFIAARYGKSPLLASSVTLIAVAGTIPYIGLQLKAVSASVTTLLGPAAQFAPAGSGLPDDVGFYIALAMAVFAILFGTRHVDATEHQDGLTLAIATESVVKLAAFLIVGLFVVGSVFGGTAGLYERLGSDGIVRELFARPLDGGHWLTVTFLSFSCILLLPRQFHVTVVENRSPHEIRRAAWLFPIYLVLINLFVVPIAAAGIMTLPKGLYDPDMLVLALPLSLGSDWMTLIAFLGGLSAATAMVIVESVALSIMVCNDVVMPAILHRRTFRAGEAEIEDMSGTLILIRRCAIFAILALGYVFYRNIGQSQALASIGLLSFAAIAQFAPVFFGGLMWRRGTASGALAGILAGFAVWAYTLFVPWITQAGFLPLALLVDGPFGLGFLRPQALFYLEFAPLAHGVFWSMLANVAAYVAVSLLRPLRPIERLQAHVFVGDESGPVVPPHFRVWRTSIMLEDLQRTAARYVGAERAERSFAEHVRSRGLRLRAGALADLQTVQFTERLLASAIGAASARLVLALLLGRESVGRRSALKLLDDASEALHYNRDLLQSAIDQVGQGIAVFDRDLMLICWNRRFRELLDLPEDLGRIGVPVDAILRQVAKRGDFGNAGIEAAVAERINRMAAGTSAFQERIAGRVLEIRTSPMPQGGFVATFSDMTERVAAAEALEQRVRERTAELTSVNRALAEAKAKADHANLDKTRFLAAASHDLLQPLNAARLYATSLVERVDGSSHATLARNIDASLEAVEDMLGALLDISRLDAGAMRPELQAVHLGTMFDRLRLEFEPVAAAKGLTLKVVPTSAWVMTDPKLLRRVLQNLVSNAIKYTRVGKVLIGCRRRNTVVSILIADTGTGIPESKQTLIFREFERLSENTAGVKGAGLGLSIVERISRVLDMPIALQSTPGRGTRFRLELAATQGSRIEDLPPRTPAGKGQIVRSVLFIDNDASIRDSMRVLLAGWGCAALTAHDGDEALALIAESNTKPEIVLADYHLDRGTGVEAVERVLAVVGSNVPVAIITADRSAEMESDVRARGFLLLRKPLRPAALRSFLARARAGAQAAE